MQANTNTIGPVKGATRAMLHQHREQKHILGTFQFSYLDQVKLYS